MKVTVLQYFYPYYPFYPYQPESYSLNKLIQSGEHIDEPFKSILTMINQYIQKPINYKEGVTLVGDFKNEDKDINDFYKYRAYVVKCNNIQYQVKLGISCSDPHSIKAELKYITIEK